MVTLLYKADPVAAAVGSNTDRSPLMTAALHGHVAAVEVRSPRLLESLDY
jgi:hypothetical protein